MANHKRTIMKNANLVGMHFANLTVMEVKNIKGREIAICRCRCGKDGIEIRPSRLINDTRPIKGCKNCVNSYAMHQRSEAKRLPDGTRLSRLVILDSKIENHARVYRCRCDCGRVVYAKRKDLVHGKVKSCGCLIKEQATSHKMSRSRLYRIWAGMKNRCQNSRNTHYKNYGGRGITICTEWEEFEPFMKWALEKGGYDEWDKRLTIDRIDTNGNYCPSNCRWVTNEAQQNNKRDNLTVIYRGTRYTASQLARIANISPDVMIKRLGELHWSVDRALKTPVHHHRSPQKRL